MESENLSVAQVMELVEKNNVQSEKVIDTANEIKLIVDYTKTIKKTIKYGNYNQTDCYTSATNFPISNKMVKKKVEVSAKLFHFNRDIESDDAISEMHKAGYRPATLMELLTLGILFPELQRQFPIIALGSIWRGLRCPTMRYVSCLNVEDSNRVLRLRLFSSIWLSHCRFLAVRLSPLSL